MKKHILGIEVHLDRKVLKLTLPKRSREDLGSRSGFGVTKDRDLVAIVGSSANINLVKGEILGLEVENLIVMRKIEGLGSVALNREVHCSNTSDGHIIELRSDAGEQVGTTNVRLSFATLRDEDRLVIDVDGKSLGIGCFIELVVVSNDRRSLVKWS